MWKEYMDYLDKGVDYIFSKLTNENLSQEIYEKLFIGEKVNRRQTVSEIQGLNLDNTSFISRIDNNVDKLDWFGYNSDEEFKKKLILQQKIENKRRVTKHDDILSGPPEKIKYKRKSIDNNKPKKPFRRKTEISNYSNYDVSEFVEPRLENSEAEFKSQLENIAKGNVRLSLYNTPETVQHEMTEESPEIKSNKGSLYINTSPDKKPVDTGSKNEKTVSFKVIENENTPESSILGKKEQKNSIDNMFIDTKSSLPTSQTGKRSVALKSPMKRLTEHNVLDMSSRLSVPNGPKDENVKSLTKKLVVNSILKIK